MWMFDAFEDVYFGSEILLELRVESVCLNSLDSDKGVIIL